MKVAVKLTKGEKKKLARLKRDMKNAHAKMLKTYDSMEKAWRKGKKASASASKSAADLVKKAKKATNEGSAYFNKVKRKYKS